MCLFRREAKGLGDILLALLVPKAGFIERQLVVAATENFNLCRHQEFLERFMVSVCLPAAHHRRRARFFAVNSRSISLSPGMGSAQTTLDLFIRGPLLGFDTLCLPAPLRPHESGPEEKVTVMIMPVQRPSSAL